MRGKGFGQITRKIKPGITPAHAGKRAARAGGRAHSRDHPRTCGEKACLSAIASHASGSPPHMRGKVAGGSGKTLLTGITPAHAGKSLNQLLILGISWDHPRTCGEKKCHAVHRTLVQGSPPHMRGKGGTYHTMGRGLGITPAHAGKSVLPLIDPDHRGDHPRTCGEKSLCLVLRIQY